MARPNPASEADNDTPNSDDWHALRGELVALLDQVEQQVGAGAAQGPGVAGLSARMRDLREQVAGAVPASRRRDALRSVQKAVERMTDREEAVADPNPRQALQSAIDEIRSRQANRAAAAPAAAAPASAPAPTSAAAATAPISAPVQSEAAIRLAQAEKAAAEAREALAREQAAAKAFAEQAAREQAIREEQARLAREEQSRLEEAARLEAERRAAAIAAEREAAAAAKRDADAREAAARAAQAAREQLAREQTAKEAASREQAAKEAAAREQAAREAAAREQAAREAAAREQAAREAQARELAAREQAAREAAQREAAAREAHARELATREQAARDAAEREAEARAEAARERAEREESARQLVRTELARVAPKVPDFSPRFDELASAVGGITGRLEKLEGQLTRQSETGTVQEVAEQVAQLSHVVEALAAAVGETGQVKRLETQIAGLAKMLVNNQKGDHVDMVALTQRLDEVSSTVERLADLQMQHVSREKELPAQQAALRNGMQVIEKSVRNVYDRIDAIEKNYSLTPADFDRLQGEMAKFADAVATASDKPQQLIALIDNLHERVSSIETRGTEISGLRNDIVALRESDMSGLRSEIVAMRESGLEALRADVLATREADMAGLKDDILALRDAVLGSVEPRFAAMEVQLEALNERVAARQPDIPGVSLIEAQVRQLVARMDQTGAQLSTLAKLYAESEERDASIDYEALADLVMNKTEEALARLERPPALDVDALANLVASRTQEKLAYLETPAGVTIAPAPQAFSDEGLNELENRMSRVFRSAAVEKEPEDLSEMQDGIRKVDERLGRLEEMLNRLNSEQKVLAAETAEPRPVPAPAPTFAPQPPFTPPPAASYTPPSDLDVFTAPTPAPTPTAPSYPLRDSMPIAPTVERPLVEQPYPDPIRSALDARNGARKRHPGLEADDPPSFSELSPLTPEMLGGPLPRTESPLAFEPPAFDPESVERPPRPASAFDLPDDVFSSGTVPTPDLPAQPAAGSAQLRNTFMEAQKRAQQRHKQPKTAVSGNSLLSRALARFQNKPEPEEKEKKALPVDAQLPIDHKKKAAIKPEAKTEPTIAAEAAVAAPEVMAKAAPAAAATTDKRPSFLTRHRQPILLALSVVALSFLTLNLINQRMSADQDTVSEQPAIATDPTAAPADAATASPVGEVVLPVAPVPSVTDPAVDATPVTEIAETVAPRVIPMVDSLATGSIDPAATTFDQSAAQPIPEAFAPAEGDAVDVAAINPAATDLPATITAVTTDSAAATDVAAVDPTAATPTPAPVALFELPPEAVGPIELRQAAANGDPRAQFEVAAIFTEGRAVQQDLTAAATWYERAANQGFAPAEYRLGNLFENGRGVTKDLEQARLWYQRAAEAGNRMSMHNLAALYAGGELGEQDFASAAKWFEDAANQGMTDSQFNLGMLYARGLGVPQDLEASFKWFSLASLSGDVDAAKSRDDIAKSLTAEQVSAISAEISTWKAAPINFAANFAPIGTWNPTFDPGPVIDKTEVVVGVQTLLTRLGYDVGAADGFAGPRTAEAIRAFERATGMSETGQINPRLLAVLSSQPV